MRARADTHHPRTLYALPAPRIIALAYWQDPGVTRAVRNGGTTRVEVGEFELK
jgi:hypothetical protein